jgi:serine O-acetyltransferase
MSAGDPNATGPAGQPSARDNLLEAPVETGRTDLGAAPAGAEPARRPEALDTTPPGAAARPAALPAAVPAPAGTDPAAADSRQPGVRRGTTTAPPRLTAARFWQPLARDFHRLRQVKGRSFLVALLDALVFDSGFQALLAYRMAHTLLRWRVPALPAACRRWAIGACGVDILPRAEIGGGCIIAHGVGLVIGGYTVIGQDCTLLHGVTLGEARFDELDYPRVGDRVTIGAGALVLGGVHVGDDATVAAGAVVVDDVAAGVTVAGVPARPVRVGMAQQPNHSGGPGGRETSR